MARDPRAGRAQSAGDVDYSSALHFWRRGKFFKVLGAKNCQTVHFSPRPAFRPGGRELKAQRKEFNPKRKEMKAQDKEMKAQDKEMKIRRKEMKTSNADFSIGYGRFWRPPRH